MITCYPFLSQRMLELGTSYAELAAVANVDEFSLRLKMLGIKRWKLTEVLRICCFFHAPDAEQMFEKRSVSFVQKVL